jgi:RNA-directed DNA polymerase
MSETSSSERMKTQLTWIAEMARKDLNFRFHTLAHQLTIELLREAHRRVRRDGAAGIDAVTADSYDQDLETNLAALHSRLRAGSYRPPPVKRVYIPKDNGEKRPIGIPTFEDKVVQRAVVMLIEPVYEAIFRDCSHGFRPNRSAHRALVDLELAIRSANGGWVLDVDLKDFFGSLNHERLMELVAIRIGDERLLRMIKRWLRAGVLSDGRVEETDQGTPQGGVISPLLANVYLHYVLDEWFEREVRPRMRGAVELVRYADDLVIVTEREDDARRIYAVLPKRLERFGLSLNIEKSRLLNFAKPSPSTMRLSRESRSSFDFLGFTHYWERRPPGWWALIRKTMRKRFRRSVVRISSWLRKNRHLPVKEQHARLSAALRGHYAYYNLPGNTRALARFQYVIWCAWMKTLGRRSQRAAMNRQRTESMAKRWPLPQPGSRTKINEWHSELHAAKSRMRQRARPDLGGPGR